MFFGGNSEGEGAAHRHCNAQELSAVSCTKTDEPIEMLFRVWICMGPRNHVLHGDAHWRTLVNTNELSVCSSNVALCQITLTTCYYYYDY